MTYRRRVRSRTRVMQAFAFLVVLVASGISTAPASAHFDSRPYIFGDKNCRNPTSPINFGFYGDRATARNTSGHTGRHTGWGKTILDSTKYFSDHGRCAPLHWARASGNSLASTRVHIRAHRLYHRDSVGRWETVAQVHLEDRTSVGDCAFYGPHVIRRNNRNGSGGGYNIARELLERRYNYASDVHMNADDYLFVTPPWGLPRRLLYWGNTAPIKQCDGGVARSDGWVEWFSFYSGDSGDPN